jgi:hypothetical protein
MSDCIAANAGAGEIQIMDNWPSSGLENEYFFCSWEWHIARLSPVCRSIYPLAFEVSGGIETKLLDRRFFASAESLAKYFDYGVCQVRRGLIELEKAGFFQLIRRKRFKPTHYRVLSHVDWASKHPGKCTNRVKYPWTGEGDPLGQSLWKMSGGEVKFANFQVANLRKLGVDEDNVVKKFCTYWEQTGQRMKPKNVPAGFYMFMKASSPAEQKCSY